MAGLVGLAIANLDLRIEFQRAGLHQPVAGAGGQRTTYEQRVIVSLHGEQFVARKILGGDVPGVLALARAAADLEAAALAQRVERESAMAPDHLAASR